jgi:hypothetical protein
MDAQFTFPVHKLPVLNVQTSSTVHATICALVEAQAAAEPAWEAYSKVFLSADVQNIIRALLLPEDATAQGVCPALDKDSPIGRMRQGWASHSGQQPGKHKHGFCLRAPSARDDVLLTIAYPGTAFAIKVGPLSLVADVKKAIAAERRIADIESIALHLSGTTAGALPDDDAGIEGLGIGPATVLYMLRSPGWSWATTGSSIRVGGDGLLVCRENTHQEGLSDYQLATCGKAMTEGRHYWEVVLAECTAARSIMIGAIRPGLDHDTGHHHNDGSYFIHAGSSGLYGHCQDNKYPQGGFAKGDRIGALLDLQHGWIRFYGNGVQCGPGFESGVKGPLVWAIQLLDDGDAVAASYRRISLTISCLDGTTFVVVVDSTAIVREVKQAIAAERGTVWFMVWLYFAGTESSLDDGARIDALGIEESAVLYMLPAPFWGWTACGSKVVLSDDNLVATTDADTPYPYPDIPFPFPDVPLEQKKAAASARCGCMATGGDVLTEGVHYWEVEITACSQTTNIEVGVARPSTDLEVDVGCYSKDPMPMLGLWSELPCDRDVGAIMRHDSQDDVPGIFFKGYRIGVLLDFEAGTMQFFVNGEKHQREISHMTGPLVRAVAMRPLTTRPVRALLASAAVRALPGAEPPAGADPSKSEYSKGSPGVRTFR